MALKQSPQAESLPEQTPLFCIPDDKINLWKTEELLGLCCSLNQETTGFRSTHEEITFFEFIEPSIICEVDTSSNFSQYHKDLGIKLRNDNKGYALTFLDKQGNKSDPHPLWYNKPNSSFYKRFLVVY